MKSKTDLTFGQIINVYQPTFLEDQIKLFEENQTYTLFNILFYLFLELLT